MPRSKSNTVKESKGTSLVDRELSEQTPPEDALVNDLDDSGDMSGGQVLTVGAVEAGFGRNPVERKRVDTAGLELVYFKLIEPITLDEAEEVVKTGYADKKLADEQVKDIEKLNLVINGVNSAATARYFDRDYNQTVDTHERPHKKWRTRFFDDRMARSREEVILQFLDTSTPPTKFFYPISESQYEKEMVPVRKKWDEHAKIAYAQAKAMSGMHSDAVKKAAAQLIQSGQTVIATGKQFKFIPVKPGSEGIEPSDPDRVTSIFKDDEQRKFVAQVRLENKLAAREV